MAGRTDVAIFQEICLRHPGTKMSPEVLLRAYLDELPVWLPKRQGEVFPGVRELLEWAHRHSEVHNVLLTGNMKEGAYHKLRHYGLADYFEFGAFSDDSSVRNDLGPIALGRARECLKKDFRLDQTWVIGDTPFDVACARSLGCKVLAVATGEHSVEQLSACKPDAVLSKLADLDEVKALLSGCQNEG